MRPPALHRFVSPNGTQGLRVLEARLSVLKVGGPTLNTRRDWTSSDLDLSAMAGNSPLEKMRDRKDHKPWPCTPWNFATQKHERALNARKLSSTRAYPPGLGSTVPVLGEFGDAKLRRATAKAPGS